MNQEELKELIHFLSDKDISEFSMERADSTIRIKRHVDNHGLAVAPPSIVLPGSGNDKAGGGVMAGKLASSVSCVIAAAEEELRSVKSPMVGIFQRGTVAHKHPFVTEGDRIEIGQVVGVIEVLRLMHEVQSDVAGTVVEIVAGEREPVEYGQPLLLIRPGQKPS